jgi:catechol 2,3-dioxygenase-like lactoylglutathione lyase family enzyme
MTAMDITIYQTLLPHEDPDASRAFYRDTLGFEVRNEVEYGGMHWITVGPPTSPARPSSCTPRPPLPASPTTSAAPLPR